MSTAPSAEDIFANFDNEIEALRETLNEAAAANAGAHLGPTAYGSVVEMVHLGAVRLFEAFLEDLFYACLLGRSGLDDVEPIIPNLDQTTADAILYSDRAGKNRYLDWLPYESTLTRATTYLLNGNPFSRIQYRDAEMRVLKEAVIVRNAVAHSSSHSLGELKKLAQAKSYQVERPADYLLSVRSQSQEAFLFIASFRLIARGLIEPDEATAGAVLGAERPFSESQISPSGTYECSSCGVKIVTTSAEKIGPCRACAPNRRCSTCGRGGATTWIRLLPAPPAPVDSGDHDGSLDSAGT
ncbi:hypothetical protein [Kribbella sp. NPDC049584]|uniref:hypothetical protein n=1 Tax=Kribbella sp. NPDC049584 TaxID=3154833 RepID=UPI003428BC72